MDVIEAIRQRRSTRSFSSRMVPDEMLRELVRAGCAGPQRQQPSGLAVLSADRSCPCTQDRPVQPRTKRQSPGHHGNLLRHGICSIHGSPNSEVYGCIMDASMAAENIMLRQRSWGWAPVRSNHTMKLR